MVSTGTTFRVFCQFFLLIAAAIWPDSGAFAISASIEFKPGLMMSSPVPGAFGLGMEAEVGVTERASLVVAANMVSEKGGKARSHNEEANSYYQLRSMESEQYAVGTRFYASSDVDSLYLGARIAARQSYYDLTYGETKFAVEAEVRETAVEAGYRWVWGTGILLRIGAQMFVQNSAVVFGEESEAGLGLLEERAVTDVSNVVENLQNDTQVVYDIGLGYYF